MLGSRDDAGCIRCCKCNWSWRNPVSFNSISAIHQWYAWLHHEFNHDICWWYKIVQRCANRKGHVDIAEGCGFTVWLVTQVATQSQRYKVYTHYLDPLWQWRIQECEKGGRSAQVWSNLLHLGVWGAASLPTGFGAEPRRQTHLGNNILKIGWKSCLWVADYTPKSDPI